MQDTLTLSEAIALQPAWIGIWLNILFFGAFILPISLLIWKATRLAAVITVVGSFASAFLTNLMYEQLGYVKLLGLPHMLFWFPIAYYLIRLRAQDTVPPWPKRIILVVVAVMAISLVFDTVDVMRYALGERTPQAFEQL
ncbi:hypothetical protein [Tateyamaria sp. ANG-S1]|uniref:hypothetical protein n=1 Tax=Tateyamaria sp. ANG-S1 TaxID=1577905 RepID=UPI00057E445C|nr:hypothetical protein [Tateyamaria sp. ANG-S1]KIC49301.1 transmembrane protein [Tateyamaria sp. ANG-S1]